MRFPLRSLDRFADYQAKSDTIEAGNRLGMKTVQIFRNILFFSSRDSMRSSIRGTQSSFPRIWEVTKSITNVSWPWSSEGSARTPCARMR
jgi:hypothetical protein